MREPVNTDAPASSLMRGINKIPGRLARLLGRRHFPYPTADFAVTPAIFDSIAAEIAVIDRQGTILAVNAPWRQFSIDNTAVPGKAASNTLAGTNYFCACETNEAGNADARAAAAGIRSVLAGQLSEFSMEYPCDSPSEKRWFTMTAKPFGHSALPDGAVITHVDVSRLKISEEKARQAEQQSARLFQAIEQSPSSMYIANCDGVIEYVNPRFVALTGYTREEAVGRTPVFLRSGATPAGIYDELWQTVRSGRTWRGVLSNRIKNGEVIWEDTSVAPIFDTQGEITHFVAVKENVSERLRAENELAEHRARLEELVAERTAELSQALEAARVADRTKDEFLANITHELRTPLAAVIGFSKLAQPLCSEPRQRAYLDSVVSAGKTLVGIIDDLLDLSKIVAGAVTFETKPFDIRKLLARVGSVIGYRAIEKGLEMQEMIGEDVPQVLLGDPLRIEQILLNLLSNAAKFTLHGHIRTQISVVEEQQDRVCLEISVEDSGIGIEPEAIRLLFKPFSQADASVTRRFGGTGLGLAICSHLAALMDGNITVSSQPGIGSCFEVRVWLARAGVAAAPCEEENVGKPQSIRYRDARALVVDDQAMNRDLVEVMLKNVGITADHACNGAQALDMLHDGSRRYDLVLMDIQMPVMDGLTATREIRSRQRFADLPVVAMTAHAMAHEREKSRSAGMNDHVGKPFNEDSFYRVLARWIPRSKQIGTAIAHDAAAAMAEFPAIPGIDLALVRSLMRGNVGRFIHWLQDFARQSPASMEDIRAALADGDARTASTRAHAFKGRSGMLGMTWLHQTAAHLEGAIDTGQCALALLDELTRLTLAMCEDIRSVIDVPAAVAPAGASIPDSSPPASVTALVARLKAGDANCDLLIRDCLDELSGTAWEPGLKEALAHSRNFDFAAACRVLAKLDQAAHC